MTWTKETSNQAIEMYCAGMTFAQIAAKLGKSRSAVAGRLLRLGFVGRRRVSDHKPSTKPEPEPEPKLRLRPKIKAKVDLRVEPHELRFTPTYRGLEALLKLRPSQCRWIYGDPRSDDYYFCCEKVARPGLSYCSYHARRAYQKPLDKTDAYDKSSPAA